MLKYRLQGPTKDSDSISWVGWRDVRICTEAFPVGAVVSLILKTTVPEVHSNCPYFIFLSNKCLDVITMAFKTLGLSKPKCSE